MRFVFLVFLITPMTWAGNWNKETFSSPENFSGLGTLHKSLQFGYKDHGVAEVKKSDGFPVFSGETSVRFEVRDGISLAIDGKPKINIGTSNVD